MRGTVLAGLLIVVILVAVVVGYLTVSTHSVTKTVTASGTHFSLVFHQVSNCPSLGFIAPWRVTLSNGESITALPPNGTSSECCTASPTYQSTIVFHVTSGNYTFYVTPLNMLTPSNGSVTVSDQDVAVALGTDFFSCGSTTTQSISWDYQGLASAVLNSSEVEPQIANAYYHIIMRYGASPPGNGTQLFADVYVVGAQTVSGNWTTGYTMTLTGQQILNVTAQYTKPSTYTITGMTVMNLTNQSNQISFNATQKQAIGIALANSTVRADIGGMAYFVRFADSQVNDSLGYWVWIGQVNGYRNLAVLVNSDLTEVTEVVVSTSPPNLGWP